MECLLYEIGKNIYVRIFVVSKGGFLRGQFFCRPLYATATTTHLICVYLSVLNRCVCVCIHVCIFRLNSDTHTHDTTLTTCMSESESQHMKNQEVHAICMREMCTSSSSSPCALAYGYTLFSGSI